MVCSTPRSPSKTENTVEGFPEPQRVTLSKKGTQRGSEPQLRDRGGHKEGAGGGAHRTRAASEEAIVEGRRRRHGEQWADLTSA